MKLTYNSEDQIEGIWFYEVNQYVQRYSYEYNQSGVLTVLKDLRDNEQYYYNYDLVGRIRKVTNQVGDVTTYDYDNAGNLNIYTYDIQGYSREVNYNYMFNIANPESIGMYENTTFGSFTKEYTFESDNIRRLQEIELTLGVTTLNTITYLYFEDGEVANGNISSRIKTITQSFNSGTYSQTMIYTSQGFIEKITNQSSQIIEFYYDDKDQLIRENNQIDSYTYVYLYDDYGNLDEQQYYNYTIGNGTLSSPLKKEQYSYDTTWNDKISTMYYYDYTNSSNNYNITYSYDSSGNVTSIDDSRGTSFDKTYTWEGRSLTSYTFESSQSVSYTYNQNGIRDSKTVNGITTSYYLDGSLVLYETDGTNDIYYTYDVDGSLISMRYNGTEYYYVFNIFGDVVYLLDENGIIVVEYRYDAYGNITHQTSGSVASANPYRYRSYRYDEDSGLYYLQSRYYNPETGRFINADGMLKASSSVLGHNMFAYTENNPVMNTDPSGYATCLASANGELYGNKCVGPGGGSFQWESLTNNETDLGRAAVIVGRYSPEWGNLTSEKATELLNDGMSIFSDVIIEIFVSLASSGKNIGKAIGGFASISGNLIQVLSASLYYSEIIENQTVLTYAILLEAILVFGSDIVVDMMVTATGASGAGIGISILLTLVKTPLSNMIENGGREAIDIYGGIYG